MKKKYFPKNSKLPQKKLNTSKKIKRRVYDNNNQNNVISFKEEFDMIMKNRYSNVSDAHKQRIWHIIGTQLTGTNIGSLEKLIKIHILAP